MFVLNQTLALDEGKWSIYIYFTKLTNTLPQWLYTLGCRMLLRTSVTFPWPLYLFDQLRVTKNRKKGLEPLPYQVDPPPPLKAQKRSAFEVVCVSFHLMTSSLFHLHLQRSRFRPVRPTQLRASKVTEITESLMEAKYLFINSILITFKVKFFWVREKIFANQFCKN